MNRGKIDASEIDNQLRQWSTEPIAPEIQRKLEQAIMDASSNLANRPPARQAPRILAMCAIAATALLVVTFGVLPLRQPIAWGQVVLAVAEEPWMRLTLQPVNSPASSTADLPGVCVWLSGDRRVAALDLPDEERWLDLSTGRQTVYSRRDDLIRGGPIADLDRENVRFMVALLDRFEAPLPGNQTAGLTLVDQQTDRVTEQSQVWDRFTFVFDSVKAPKQHTYTLLVDPETRRPSQMQVQYLTTQGLSPPLLFLIDYPKNGPNDVYFLGAARSAELLDEEVNATESTE